ncbi:conserved hypothetical protein [Talaromyces stipitatus ATCC 10500]|uniref:Small EDRK-rich factor-like N-terminal domain-containing protein n=1 Tax=Talaromyces stipitatus (strain ATCC 10500 / CBS 375.48 / QM 6759 / NRRL 1006) TaxID=441959 RepID=B8LUD8_TALSN|nr:uncharacterized protein TSTA_071140 [Talaromyces stipitatus ATCC 10500]EED23711.1 conserved hypothetical protein [Talaromyces stipitatus ATCC 10500]
MTRGNQRENARKKNLEKQAKAKSKNTMSGTEYQREKEKAAEIMREKQRKALEKKAAEAAAGGGKK